MGISKDILEASVGGVRSAKHHACPANGLAVKDQRGFDDGKTTHVSFRAL